MSEQSFESRLIAAMGEMANPSKSSTATVPTKNGGRYTYKYETLDQVLAAVRPPLIKNGIGLTQRQAWDEKTEQYVLQTIVFDEGHRETLDERPMMMPADAQARGSWETYMRRYALRSAFGLAGEDDDGKAAKDYAAQEPRNPTNHPLGKTVQKPVDKRKKMLARCAQLSAQCIENGMNAGATDTYMVAHFGVQSMDELTDEQLIEFGTYLKQMEEQGRAQKERKNDVD